jgi:hypothetical protein
VRRKQTFCGVTGVRCIQDALPLMSPSNHVRAAMEEAVKVMVPTQRTTAIVDAFASLKKPPSSIVSADYV